MFEVEPLDAAPPSPDELVARAIALVPMLRENATKAEQMRRLPDETVRAVEEAGLFRMLRPVARGGYGTDAATMGTVMATVASGCASTVWIMIVYTAVAQFAELLSEDALAEIYASANPKIAGAFGRSGATVVRAPGGFRVRGEGLWPFNSGCHHAAWDLLRMTVEEPDGSSWPAFAAVPIADLTICDDWQVMGAQGTGSCTVTCGEMIIPERRVARVPVDLLGVLRQDILAAQNCALPLGMARHAFEAFTEMAKSKGINHLGYARMGDAPVVQSAVAVAAADLKLIESYQQWLMSAVASGAALSAEDAAVRSIGSVRCFELARQSVERFLALSPAGEIRQTQPLQRILRDMHAFQHQPFLTPFIHYELYGRKFFAS